MSDYTSMSFNLMLQGNSKNDTIQTQSINLVCPVCLAGYVNKKEFYNHLRVHAGDALLKHMQCLKNDADNELSQTELIHSSQEKIDDNFYETVLRPFKCQQCDLTFDRASQYDYHYRSIHLGEKSQLCEICGKGFFRKADLKTHLNIHLGTNICICEVCGRKFNHISNLIRHCRMHAGVKLYPCSICGKRFTQISSLARHKRIHERQKEDKNLSQKNFSAGDAENNDNTTSKSKSVEGSVSSQQKVIKRQHYCKVCGESFSFIFLLRKHEKSHSQSLESKNNGVKAAEPRMDEQTINNFEFFENEINIKKGLPLETIIYITSEQLKKINLENIEDNRNHVSQETLCETKLLANEELNDSEESAFNHEHPQLVHNNPLLLCKSSDSTEQENVAYVCQVDESILKNKLCVQPCETDFQKSEAILNYNTLLSTSANVTDLFQKIDLSEPNSNEHLNSEPNIQRHPEPNLVENEKTSDDLNDINNIVNNDEPMLRLVQTETGEQFYEFLINNLVEKLPSTESEKASENKDENTSMNEDHQEQSIRDDMHSDLNYAPYELHGEERNFVTNQILLDTQTDFDKYVETNFEVFERLNYDDTSERFLEFVETTGLDNQNSKISDCNKEAEQFLQFQNFNEIDPMQQNGKNTIIGDSSNVNTDEILENNENQELNSDIISNDEKIDEQQQESEKLKTFLIKFQCTVCEKSFSTSYNYKQHIGTHFADQQKFHCKDCNMSFAWKSTLNKHIANNHRPEGPQKFACDICNKIYNTSSQVNEHVKRDHLKQRNHVCSQCGKSFFKKYDLKIHNRIHTDERPYVCRACGKRFHHRSHIIRHERIHF